MELFVRALYTGRNGGCKGSPRRYNEYRQAFHRKHAASHTRERGYRDMRFPPPRDGERNRNGTSVPEPDRERNQV